MSITIKEIAILAQTSRGTVDRVVNNRGGVSEKLEERIRKIMIEHNYQSNKYARALGSSNKIYKIGIIINSIGNEFYDTVRLGIEAAAKNYLNVQLVINEIKGYDDQEQIKSIDNIVQNHDLSALIISPINTINVKKRLNEINIPIIHINTDADSHKLAFVGCDYQNSGDICGDLGKLLIPTSGKILIVAGSFKLLGHKLRVDGFESKFNSEPENYQISKIENNDDDRISYKLVKEHIEKEDVDLVYFCAAGIKGGLKALKELNSQAKIITVDETQTVIENLRSGYIAGTITQQPYKQGYKAVEIAADYLIYGNKPEDAKYITGNHVKLKNSYFNINLDDNNE